MKKILLLLSLIMTFVTINAQTSNGESVTDGQFNKWSIEFGGGFNKPLKPMRYSTSTISPYVIDLGARYMFNNKFGLKADLGYNSFQAGKNSTDFNTKYYRANLQGVVNLGRIMNFETWTNTLGLLAHTGFGVAQLEDQNSAIKDRMVNFLIGATAQVKLSNKFVLTGDLSTIYNAMQTNTFDAAAKNPNKGFSGQLFNGTVGLTYYLGQNEKHADWVTFIDKDFLTLKDRVNNLEKMLIDTDKDGVADYLDLEPKTLSGLMVDSKGIAVDLNRNGVPDELEGYLAKTYGNKTDEDTPLSDSKSITKLINGGYVAVYFDFNKSTPTDTSTDGINFVLNYLRNNPSSTVEITGYSDEVGDTVYNEKLSDERANVVKNILLKANIAPSRISVVAAGEDTSVDKNSSVARKLVRRVTFKINQ